MCGDVSWWSDLSVFTLTFVQEKTEGVGVEKVM